MLHIDGYEDSTPTRLLTAALKRLAPELFEPTPPAYADVAVVPRCTRCPCDCDHPVTRTGWYDLYYVHEAAHDYGWDRVRIAHIDTLPPPPVIPQGQRLAAAPEPTLEGWSPEQIAMVGGREEARQHIRHQQRIAIRDDRRASIYDWDTAAETYVEILRNVPNRKLTAEQRVRVGEAREMRALAEVADARKSVRQLRANAGMDRVPHQDGPGRPAVGPQVSVSLTQEEKTALDRLCERTRAFRSAHLREAVRLYLRIPEDVSDLPDE